MMLLGGNQPEKPADNWAQGLVDKVGELFSNYFNSSAMLNIEYRGWDLESRRNKSKMSAKLSESQSTQLQDQRFDL